MDYQTAAAISRNLSGVADAFLQMTDPRARAEAMNLRTRNQILGIEAEYAPQKFQADIDLTNARTATEGFQQKALGAQAGNYDAQAGKYRAEAENWGIRNDAGRALIGGAAPATAAGAFTAPFTHYSTGADVGGPDELQDKWTNAGYTATGQNLVPGVVAVNPKVHPHGTVFRDPQTGETFLAADTHGNKDPNVIDFYQPPGSYTPQKGQRQLEVVGREEMPYGKVSGSDIANILARYRQPAPASGLPPMEGEVPVGAPAAVPPPAADPYALANVFAGAGADDLARAQARAAMLGAQTEQQGRNASAAISGQLPGAGEYATAAEANAYQARGIEGELAQEQIRQQGENVRDAASIFAGGGRAGSSTAGSGTGSTGLQRNPLNTTDGLKATLALAGERFGMLNEETGQAIIDPALRPMASAWQSSVSTLTGRGIDAQTAVEIADRHHNVSVVGSAGEGMFDGDPRKVVGEGFNPSSITPAEADAYAASYGSAGGGALGGFNPARLGAAAMLDPRYAALMEETQTAEPAPALAAPVTPDNSPALVAGPPVSLRDRKASDEFKPMETDDARQSREKRDARMKELEAKMADLVNTLRSGETTVPRGVGGGMGGGIGTPNPGSRVKLSPQGYNSALEQLRKMEAELQQLRNMGRSEEEILSQYGLQ